MLGLRITSSEAMSTKVGLTKSLMAAVSASVSIDYKAVEASASVEKSSGTQKEITQVLSSQTERSWSTTIKTTFTAPAKKYFIII